MTNPEKYKVIYAGGLEYDLNICRNTILKMANELGGFESIYSRGSKVLLKPNLVLRSERSRNALTDPIIVEAVISILLELGVKISLGDSPSFESAATVANSNGIKAVCDRYNVPIISFNKNAIAPESDPKSWKIFQQIRDFDAVLNLPKLKGHGQLYFTGGVKNLFGCVAGKTKFIHHMVIGDKDFNFASMLLEVAYSVNPSLTIIDGIGAMAGNGPLHGEPVDLGLLAMCKSPLPLDISICKLLNADMEKVDIYKSSLIDKKWEKYLEYEDFWLTNKEIGNGFYFPKERRPIRFSISHAMKSVYKTIKKRFIA